MGAPRPDDEAALAADTSTRGTTGRADPASSNGPTRARTARPGSTAGDEDGATPLAAAKKVTHRIADAQRTESREAPGESVAQGRARAQQMRAKLAAKSPAPANDTDTTDKTGTNGA